MPPLKLLSAPELERLILSIGFVKMRQKGGHALYRHPDGRTTTIPHHGSKDLQRSLIRKILKDICLSVEQYNALIKD